MRFESSAGVAHAVFAQVHLSHRPTADMLAMYVSTMFAALFAEAQSEPLSPQSNFHSLAVCVCLLTTAFFMWNYFEATSVVCIVVYVVWGLRALVSILKDESIEEQPRQAALHKFKKVALISAVIFVCMVLSLGLGWANVPFLRLTGQRMMLGQVSSVVSMLALCSAEFCALASVAQYFAKASGKWKWFQYMRERWARVRGVHACAQN